MIIGITGLHGAGKTYFCNTIPQNFGFRVFSKKQELEKIYKRKTGRDDWQEWYRREYKKNPRKITEFILLGIRKNENVLYDAVHSPVEWNIIKDNFPNAELVEIVTPELIRRQRITPLDLEKDKKRIEYWHSDNNCLLSQVNWAFNGAGSKELNQQSFKEFLDYIKEKDKMKEEEIEH